MSAESKGAPKLTQFSHGAGCGCKLPAADLHAVMSVLPRVTDPRLVISTDTGDDAAVYDLGDGQMLIQTLDFFTPVVDDPYIFGAIAAANAISDVYAMGGRPIFGLNIVAFPSKTLDLGVLRDILKGGSDKAREAGFFIAGGHSIDDAEPKFGMVVNGLARREDILSNSTAQVGDVVIITKPLGVGIMTTAVKKGIATESDIQPAIDSMSALNKPGAEACNKVGAHAATDITGFGLLGHVGNGPLRPRLHQRQPGLA
jgi:selenium donor protein